MPVLRRNYIICVAMILIGMAGGGWLSSRLAEHDALDFPVNPFGLYRSPYGEVFAMAMQGPIDAFWIQGQIGQSAAGTADSSDPRAASVPSTSRDDEEAPSEALDSAHGTSQPWNDRLRRFLERLETASKERTNPHRASTALDFHIRQQVERKLRFAYQLDPAHYGNYNSYHFFLSEPEVGTRPMITPAIAELARETIDYCLADAHDPRPSLTGAAAATNLLHLMFVDQSQPQPTYGAAQMREALSSIDRCLDRHHSLRDAWLEKNHDALLSPLRLYEMEQRSLFVRKIRDAAEAAVIRHEGGAVRE